MERIDRVFLLVVVLSVGVGAATALDVGSRLEAVDTASAVDEEIEAELSDVTVRNGELRFTVTLSNPTGVPLEVGHGFVRAFNATTPKLAFGPATRVDQGGDTLAAGGTLAVRYVVSLTDAQAEQLTAALAVGDVNVTLRQSLRFRDVEFAVTRTEQHITGAGTSGPAAGSNGNAGRNATATETNPTTSGRA